MRIYEIVVVISEEDMNEDLAKEIMDGIEAGIKEKYQEGEYLILPPQDVTEHLNVVSDES